MIFEKIRERLQKQSKDYEELAESQDNVYYQRMYEVGMQATEEAFEIIDQVEAEYNNGWISVDDRLPEGEGVYIVTEEEECEGIRYCSIANFVHNHPKHKWWDVNCEYVYFGNVTAWMPLPEPFKKGE